MKQWSRSGVVSISKNKFMSSNFLANFINIKEYLLFNPMLNLTKNISFGIENSADTYCSLLFDSEIEINRI